MNFVINNWYLFVALVFVLAMLLGGPITQLVHGIKNIGVADAVRCINHESAVVIDVCQPNEFQTGHIPQAVNIPLGDIGKRTAELDRFKGRPVIVTCRSGNRSVKGASMIKKLGFDPVYSLSGGLMAWQRDNLPVEK